MKPLLCAMMVAFSAPLVAQQQGGSWGVQGPINLFTTDDLGNLYVLKGAELDLYDRQGKLIARNSFNRFGTISSISAYSSLKPVIFSKRQAQLAMLDNTLSVQGDALDLSRSGRTGVSLVCAGVQNCFWFYDEREMAITRVGLDLQPLASSGRLDQTLGFSPQPTYMEEADGRLYVVVPDHGVLVFDLFASFMRTLPIQGVDRIQVYEKEVWYVQQGQLNRYDPRTLSDEVVPWPQDIAGDGPINQARIAQGRLYLSTPSGIQVQRIGR